jgi:hypothetical protein
VSNRETTTTINPIVDGKQWHLFEAEYTNVDGRFGLRFHALSMEHAAAIVEEIKETLTLTGQVTGEVKA